MAMHTIDVFEASMDPVVTPSGSCAAMIKHGYLELFADDPAWLLRAENLARRTYELSEFLVDRLGITECGASWAGKLAYHRSCHLLRELGVDRQPLALLKAVSQATLVELPGSDECCGFGGVFSVEQPEISSAMLQRKLANLTRVGRNGLLPVMQAVLPILMAGCGGPGSGREQSTWPKFSIESKMAEPFRVRIKQRWQTRVCKLPWTATPSAAGKPACRLIPACQKRCRSCGSALA